MKNSFTLTLIFSLIISLFAIISKMISVKITNKYQFSAFIASNAVFCVLIYLVTVFLNE